MFTLSRLSLVALALIGGLTMAQPSYAKKPPAYKIGDIGPGGAIGGFKFEVQHSTLS